MCNTDTDDETECAIDLSVKECAIDLSVVKPEMPTLKPYSLELLGSPKRPHAAKTVPVLGTSRDDDDQPEKLDSHHSKTKIIIVVPPSTDDEQQVERLIRYIPLQSVSRTVEKHYQEASTSKPSSSKPLTSEVPASKAPTPLASTSNTSPSKALTSKAFISSKASTSEGLTSKASTSKVSTSKPSTSKASTSKASPSKPSTSKASVSKASPSKASTSKPSRSRASPSKVSISKEVRRLHYNTLGFKGRKQVGPREKSESKASTSTSVYSKSDDESDFWLRTAKTKFNSNEFRAYLRDANFSELQAESLQNLLHKMARNMPNAINNSDRVVKMHRCDSCEFSICDQCVCIFYLHPGMPTSDPVTFIKSQETIICICNFAFFHAHDIDSSLAEAVNIASVQPEQQPPRRRKNIATIRCSACNTIVIIQHPPEQIVENTLIEWSVVEGGNKKAFHASITAHLKQLSVTPPSLGEMFMCTNKCCLFFHRCNE